MSGISKGWRVLDVACGTGAVAQQLLQRTGNGGLVVGVDASHTALLLAKKYVRGANFHPVICDAEVELKGTSTIRRPKAYRNTMSVYDVEQ